MPGNGTQCFRDGMASRLILIAGDILINTPPARDRTTQHPKETGTFLRALATQRKKGGDSVATSLPNRIKLAAAAGQ